MEKKKPAGAPLWMVTYSDMVTLLLTFFVMLLAMANFEDSHRVDAVLGSIQAALGSGASYQSSNANGNDSSKSPDPQRKGERDFDQLKMKLSVAMAEHRSDDLIKLSEEQTEIRITLSDRILFAPGSTQLHPVAYKAISDVSSALEGHDVQVEIEGHADGTGSISKNWNVSAQRALVVLTAMQERGTLDGDNLRATAMGQFYPVNLETGASEWNRRVEIVIRSQVGATHDAIEQLEGGW